MKVPLLLSAVAAVVVFGVTAAPASASPGVVARPFTPNSCIAVNGGDFNACNVGNSGRGDLKYRPSTARTPNSCIALNDGDANACNVGNRGRGDLPYLRVTR